MSDDIVATPDDEHHDVISQAEVNKLSDGHTHCLVCYSDLTLRGKAPCDHNDICGVCHLRLRFLHDDKKCPICKTSNESIIVDIDATKKFDEYPMWGDEIGAGFIHRSDVGMFFENQYYESEILPLFGYACKSCEFRGENEPAPGKKSTPLKVLQDHLRTKHRESLCQLCVDHKRDFVSRLPRMNPKQLQNHLRNGDGPTSGFSGHPVCEFCKPKRFYDVAFLHQHLHKEHYKCHVCEKQGLDNQFFKNYKSLEKHFDHQHFLCHDVQCLAARFVVFENELDFRAHELSVHGGTSTGSTKINLEFRTRRAGYDGSGLEDQQAPPSDSDFNYGLDGQAFVPQALPTSNQNNTTVSGRNASSNVQLHPQHVQRTEELRAHAAAIREQQAAGSQEELFPTLQSANTGPSSAPLIGWSQGSTMQRVNVRKKNAGQVTEQDFPTLPTISSAKSNAKKKALRGNLGATRRQFDAMSMSASQPQSQPSWGGPGAGAVGSVPSASRASGNFFTPTASIPSRNNQANLSADNFPSLGPSSNVRHTYSAANAYAKKNAQNRAPAAYAPAINSQSDFPSMTSMKPAGKKAGKARGPVAQPPSLSSSMDFPAPPSASSNRNQASVRNRVMGDNRTQPSQQAMSNVLPATLSASAAASVTVEEMKASMGPKKYKQLKNLTRTFAEGQLSPEGYVDQSAALFDRGYGDTDFWSFIPSLLESCPNQSAADHAQNYMVSLKRQQFSDKSLNFRQSAPSPAPSSWGGGGVSRHNVMQKPPASTATARRPAASRPVPQPIIGRPNVVASKKKSSWGGTGQATVARANAPPGSVAAAAAAQKPQGGTATKFMAKQQKQAKQQPKQNGKSKKTSKAELRALAFGN